MAADGRRRAASADDPDAIHREVRIAARPDVVFAFLTDPVKIARWSGTHAESDPRRGGVHRTVINCGHVTSGAYVEVVPNRTVVYTWGWVDSAPIPPGSTVVEVVLVPDGDGTVLRLAHTMLPAAARKGHGEVWDTICPGWPSRHQAAIPAPIPGRPGQCDGAVTRA